ncbi:MAG: dipeptidase [Acidobacteriota bacterium]
MIMRARWWLATGLVVAIAAGVAVAPRVAGEWLNPTLLVPPYQASSRAQRLHASLFVSDLHADSLLWSRDLATRSDWGHVDVPRLIAGGVALQAFTVVTQVPYGQNIESNPGDRDELTLLVIAGRWPFATWASRLQRALYQAGRLRQYEVASGGRLCVITTRPQLDAYVDLRRTNTEVTAGWLGIEGTQALDGSLSNLDALDRAGFRMIGITHFFDIEFGGSAHGLVKGGLTPMGRELVGQMEARHILVDLAHASNQTIMDVVALSKKPVIVSHTGVRGTCNNTRNLDDERLQRIAATGGVIGIGYWTTAVCGPDADAVARAIRYTANLVGVDAVALGSDFDGAISAPFDTTGVVLVTDALVRSGFSDVEIRKIMGGNVLRVLRQSLPDK